MKYVVILQATKNDGTHLFKTIETDNFFTDSRNVIFYDVVDGVSINKFLINLTGVRDIRPYFETEK